jgi:hypothetical protein
MIGTSQLINTFSRPCFTDTTDIFKDGSGVALYGLDYDASDAGGASGKFGEAAIFNGSSSKIVVEDSSANAFGFANMTGSISAWVNPAVLGTSMGIAAKRDQGSPGNRQWIFRKYSDNKIQFYAYQTDSNSQVVISTSTIPQDSWTHVVVTLTTSEMKIYLNGVLDKTTATSYTTIQNDGADLTIGTQGANSSSNYWNGKIDQVRIYNTALTQSQVTQLSQENNSTVGTHLFGCIANYNLDGSAKESMGTTAYDGVETDITYRYDGTPTNVDFGVGGKSNYGAGFNGSSSAIVVPNNILTANDHSISTWFNLDSTNGIQTVVEFDYENRILFRAVSTDSNKAYIGDSDYFDHGISFSAGQWYHLVITFSAGNPFKIYVNGVLSYTGGNASVSAQSNDNIIGASNSSGANGVDGKIDQVRIFSKALSSGEVSKLYGNGAGEIACAYTSTTDNIALPITNTAYYKLDNNSKDSARSSGKFNEGAIFNGTSSNISIPTLGGSFYDSDFSISLWVNLNSLGAGSTGYLFSGAGSRDVFINFNTGNSGGGISARLYDGAIRDVVYSSAVAGQWYHVVFVRSKTNGLNLYVDGVSRDTNSYTGNAQALSFTSDGIGGRVQDRNTTDGKIDQVRLFNVALSSADVSNLYTETASDTNTLSFPSGQTAIATYQLDGNSTDLSGNYNGTDTNITYAYDGTDTNVEYRFGRYGQAAVFNGSSSLMTITDGGIGANGTARVSFSVSLWIKTTASNQSAIISDFGSNYGFYIQMESSASGGAGKLSIANFYTGGLVYTTAGTAAINDGNWHHLVLVNDTSDNTQKLYLDGNTTAAIDQTLGTGTKTANAIQVGYYTGYVGTYNFDGSIDQTRLFSSALSNSQVAELYNEKPEVDTSNFKTVLYEGNGGTNFVSNVGFEPDLVWVKARDDAHDHVLYDTVRGVGAGKALSSNATYAEGAYDATYGFLDTFEATGFVAKTGSSVANYTNKNNESYVAWVWKGGGDAVAGTGTGVTNVSVSANTDAGFSIVKYTGGNGISDTVNHGLADAEMIILKDLTDGTNHWRVWHKDLTSGYWLYLSLRNAQVNASTDGGIRNVDANTFGFINGTTAGVEGVNSNVSDYIAYVWKSVAGYSRISTYEGNGTTDNKIYTTDDGTSTGSNGFKPSFVMLKNVDTDNTGWLIHDTARDPVNTSYHTILANANAVEYTSQSYWLMDFESDGFRLKYGADNEFNKLNDTYIYMAFK